MKLAIFDPYLPKFTQDMIDWWRGHGYDLRIDRYYDPELVEWADVVWFDTTDNNLLSATNPGDAIQGTKFFESRTIPWDMHEMDLSGKKIIVRPIDIEVWQGHHAHDHMWDVVNDVVFLAPHIQQIMMADSRPQEGHFKQHVIPCGVNLDRWTYKERERGYQIGVVAERWISKGVDYVLQIALRLKEIDPRYQITWLGKNNDYHWEHEYFKDFIQHNKLPIVLEEDFVDDLDQWWEDKNFVLHAAHKETYTYAVAEAMAKGIKPILHRYYGADATWPEMTWTSVDEAVELITEDKYDSASYRQYLLDHHLDLESMMQSFEAVIHG